MNYNPILDVDSYKHSHFRQYPPGTNYVSAYIEPRGGPYEKVMFFGLQMFLKKYLSQPITKDHIDEAEVLIKAHGEPFNRDGWERIVHTHGGFFPIVIQALAEGTVTRPGIPQVQICNTDPELPWVTTFIETALLRAVWFPSTVATVSYNVKQTIKEFLEKTADTLDGLPFKLHDFGARGTSSHESAGIGGVAHLVNFMGTDTVPALEYARDFYDEPVAGFSIPAAEHSTITTWLKSGEADAYRNMVRQFGGPGKLFAVVSDSYDIYNAVSNIWGDQLKAEVIGNGGTLVVRPDSGDPTRVPVELLDLLEQKFGSMQNSKGYKLLPSYLRIIQGDGVNPDSIRECLSNMKLAGWSADNIAFGMGGQLLQQVHRDTLKYACKANAIRMNRGPWIDVSKNPVGDPTKASKAGRLAVVSLNGRLEVRPESDITLPTELRVVWDSGTLLRETTLKEARARQ